MAISSKVSCRMLSIFTVFLSFLPQRSSRISHCVTTLFILKVSCDVSSTILCRRKCTSQIVFPSPNLHFRSHISRASACMARFYFNVLTTHSVYHTFPCLVFVITSSAVHQQNADLCTLIRAPTAEPPKAVCCTEHILPIIPSVVLRSYHIPRTGAVQTIPSNILCKPYASQRQRRGTGVENPSSRARLSYTTVNRRQVYSRIGNRAFNPRARMQFGVAQVAQVGCPDIPPAPLQTLLDCVESETVYDRKVIRRVRTLPDSSSAAKKLSLWVVDFVNFRIYGMSFDSDISIK